MFQRCPICNGCGRNMWTEKLCSVCNGAKIIDEKTGQPPPTTNQLWEEAWQKLKDQPIAKNPDDGVDIIEINPEPLK